MMILLIRINSHLLLLNENVQLISYIDLIVRLYVQFTYKTILLRTLYIVRA